MNDAIAGMLKRYDCKSLSDHVLALREILQEIALLGLWRSKFFEKAAFYGGTSLRLLHGQDRFSEDLDFSLLFPIKGFDLSLYSNALQKELAAFGFDVQVDNRPKTAGSAIQSAFLKANTLSQLLVIQATPMYLQRMHREQVLKIKIEVDTDPPPGFDTETRFILLPIQFAVRVYELPDLFAGKMHAILCRRWKNRSKGRDWYGLVWYATHQPRLHITHLEQQMRQTGHWTKDGPPSPGDLNQLIENAIENLNVDQVRKEVEPFVKNPMNLEIWSHLFFRELVKKIQVI